MRGQRILEELAQRRGELGRTLRLDQEAVLAVDHDLGDAARPVVATRVGGIPEVMIDGEHGLLIEPQRPAELASALGKLLENPLAAHVMGLRGRQFVEREFSLDRMCARVTALYDSLVGQVDESRADRQARFRRLAVASPRTAASWCAPSTAPACAPI